MKQLGQCNKVPDRSFSNWKHCNTSYFKACRYYWMGSASDGAFIIFCICHRHNVLHRHERWWWLQYALRCSHLIHKCKKMLILVLCRTLFFLVTANHTFIYVCLLFSKHGVLIEWYILYMMSVFTVLSQYISFLLRIKVLRWAWMIQYFFPAKEVPILVWSKRDGCELRNIIRSWLIQGQSRHSACCKGCQFSSKKPWWCKRWWKWLRILQCEAMIDDTMCLERWP